MVSALDGTDCSWQSSVVPSSIAVISWKILAVTSRLRPSTTRSKEFSPARALFPSYRTIPEVYALRLRSRPHQWLWLRGPSKSGCLHRLKPVECGRCCLNECLLRAQFGECEPYQTA